MSLRVDRFDGVQEDHCWIALQWYSWLKQNGQFQWTFHAGWSPFEFLNYFQNHADLFFQRDQYGCIVRAFWLEPFMNCAFAGAFSRRASSRQNYEFFTRMYDYAFSKYPTLIGIVHSKRPDLKKHIRLHHKWGYCLPDTTIKGAFENDDALTMQITRENWEFVKNLRENRYEYRRRQGQTDLSNQSTSSTIGAAV